MLNGSFVPVRPRCPDLSKIGLDRIYLTCQNWSLNIIMTNNHACAILPAYTQIMLRQNLCVRRGPPAIEVIAI